MMIPLIIFSLYDKVILPSFDISNGSVRETLSVPIMQLSRVIKYKPDVFTDRDKEIINKVLDFESIRRLYMSDVAIM